LFQYQNLKQRWLIYQSHFDINLAFGKTPKPPVCVMCGFCEGC
jgi:hypothetical protein